MGPNVRDHIRNPENRALYRLKIKKKHFFFEECVLFFFSGQSWFLFIDHLFAGERRKQKNLHITVGVRYFCACWNFEWCAILDFSFSSTSFDVLNMWRNFFFFFFFFVPVDIKGKWWGGESRLSRLVFNVTLRLKAHKKGGNMKTIATHRANEF